MKTVQIKAKPFFDLLKMKNQSMWEIFAQLINGEEQLIVFTQEDDSVLFDYVLPKTVEELNEQQKEFTEEFKNKVQSLYN